MPFGLAVIGEEGLMAGPDRRDTGVNSRAAEFRDFHTLLDFPIQGHRRPVQFQAVLLDLLAECL